MATSLLSLASNSLHWGLISSDLGPLAVRLVHPTASVLLTKSGLLDTPIRDRGRAKLGRPGNFAHWKFENGLKPLRPQHP